jgi:HEAT repeat protein
MSSEIPDWNICSNIEEMIQFLQKSIEQDKDSSIRISSVLGLLIIAHLKPSYYEHLITYLKSLLLVDDLYCRGSAALSIGILGSKLDDPIPFLDMLKLLLFDEARFVQRNASVGLAFIASASTSKEKRLQLLEDLLTSSYWYFRLTGSLSLGFFCEETEIMTIFGKLKPILNDADTDVRIGAIYGLGIIAQKFAFKEKLIPFFKSCLLDYDSAVIHSAIVVLNLLSFES